jgi:hypothetical protein
MQAEFEIVVWRSLANAPPLDELLSSLLKFLMPLYGEDPIIPTTLDQQISKLMQYLRSRRCLLLLDNAETILQREPGRTLAIGLRRLRTVAQSHWRSVSPKLFVAHHSRKATRNSTDGRCTGTSAIAPLSGLTPMTDAPSFGKKERSQVQKLNGKP